MIKSLLLGGSLLVLISLPAQAERAGPPTRQAMQHGMGDQTLWMVNVDRIEIRSANGEDALAFEGNAFWGGDINKVWLRFEGDYDLEADGGHDVELSLLYSRAVTPFFDLQGGLAHRFSSGDDRSYALLGLKGHAPYWIGIDTAFYVSEEGDLSARFEAERDILLTQRLILQPRFETRWADAAIPADMEGSGFTHSELGVRLRYDISRQFSPFMGVSAEWAHGETADLVEASGGDTHATAVVIGVKFWF